MSVTSGAAPLKWNTGSCPKSATGCRLEACTTTCGLEACTAADGACFVVQASCLLFRKPRSQGFGTVSCFAFIATLIVAFTAASAFCGADARHATQQIREYFEFPRRVVVEGELSGLNLSYSLPATREYPAVIFARAPDPRPGLLPSCGDLPVVLTTLGSKWWITNTRLHSWYWTDIWTTADRGRIWAVLDFSCEGPGNEIILLFSSDGGWTWRTLSKVDQGYFQSYDILRMAPDGRGTLIIDQSGEDIGIPCPEDAESAEFKTHHTCKGWDLHQTNDGGVTWGNPTFVHGDAFFLESRKECQVRPLTEYKHFNLEGLRERFEEAKGSACPSIPSGSTNVGFDEALLRRAQMVTPWSGRFLEATAEPHADKVYPFILSCASKYDDCPAALIKLPYANHQWRAYGGLVGILQPPEQGAREARVFHAMNQKGQWIDGRLDQLPSEAFQFDRVCMSNEGHGELHLRRILCAEDEKEAGRYVYESADGGRTWVGPRFEADLLVPVEHVWFWDDKPVDETIVVERSEWLEATSEFFESTLKTAATMNGGVGVPPLKMPATAELAGLLRAAGGEVGKEDLVGVDAWLKQAKEPQGAAEEILAVYRRDDITALPATGYEDLGWKESLTDAERLAWLLKHPRTHFEGHGCLNFSLKDGRFVGDVLAPDDAVFLQARRDEVVEHVIEVVEQAMEYKDEHYSIFLLGWLKAKDAIPLLRRGFIEGQWLYTWGFPFQDPLDRREYPAQHCYEEAIEHITGQRIEQVIELTEKEIGFFKRQQRQNGRDLFPALYVLSRLAPDVASEVFFAGFRSGSNKWPRSVAALLDAGLSREEVVALLGEPDAMVHDGGDDAPELSSAAGVPWTASLRYDGAPRGQVAGASVPVLYVFMNEGKSVSAWSPRYGINE